MQTAVTKEERPSFPHPFGVTDNCGARLVRLDDGETIRVIRHGGPDCLPAWTGARGKLVDHLLTDRRVDRAREEGRHAN